MLFEARATLIMTRAPLIRLWAILISILMISIDNILDGGDWNACATANLWIIRENLRKITKRTITPINNVMHLFFIEAPAIDSQNDITGGGVVWRGGGRRSKIWLRRSKHAIDELLLRLRRNLLIHIYIYSIRFRLQLLIKKKNND